MNAPAKRKDVLAAAQDLRWRSLSQMPQALERLIYLSSTRDYNTGFYRHEGLAVRFSEEAACEALADCHREAFRDLVGCSLEELVHQLQRYAERSQASVSDFIAAWKELEPYRVAIPAGTDSLSSELLFSNLKIALAILETRQMTSWAARPGASPRPSLVR
ncbi:MAG: hypothetical protein WA211_10165 [Candidatus Acidiferrales bacterium]